MIHRALFGSIERFFGVLIEHYAGAFPLWLAPVQVAVLPITDRINEYADSIAKELRNAGFRVEANLKSDKIGAKIRDAQLQKVPYMLVLGDKELEVQKVAVRERKQGDIADVEVYPKMEGYQMFTIFVPKKVSLEAKKKAPKPEPAAPAPEKRERTERPKPAAPEAGEAKPASDDDDIF
jgi:histidyl-tRNA synthetase